MNILFLTLLKITSLEERGIYSDLLRKFKIEGHHVSVVCPCERREKMRTNLIVEDGTNILRVRTLNIQKANIIEKGIGILALEYQYLKSIKKYFTNINFDLVLYSTPPITFTKVVSFIKNRDNAYAYLLLKDIFPQNAVDMKLLREGSLLHKYFIKKEKKLYEISDSIGCMSAANKEYLIKHYSFIKKEIVEVNPNSISPLNISMLQVNYEEIKNKYSLPLDKKIFIYGGNLGIPQGLDFLLETIELNIDSDIFFLIVGSGTEFKKIKRWFYEKNPSNAILLSGLPKEEYDQLLKVCDVGLIFLSKNFTIPNFPSRLLSYLEMKMPIIAATDINSDIGIIIEEYKCGFWVISGDGKGMEKAINKINSDEVAFLRMKENAWELLQQNYTVENSYNLIVNKLIDV